MEAVKSRDGTPIAYERAGSGPPLVLVHGSTSDHDTAYRYVIPMLERYFTVRALDRRGRGDSGDGLDYSLERELDDVMAVIESAGEPVNLFGPGFGALVASRRACAPRTSASSGCTRAESRHPGAPSIPRARSSGWRRSSRMATATASSGRS